MSGSAANDNVTRMLRVRVVIALVVLAASWGLSACIGWGPERLCSGDETFVQRTEEPGSGAWCDPRQPGDPECERGERARRIESTGRTDCVPDRA